MYQIVAAWQGSNPSVEADFIWGIGFYVLLALWMRADAQQRSFPLPLDYGLLLYAFGPIYLPWYMWCTRRWQGVVIAVVILFAGYAPYLIGDLVWAYLVA